MKKFKTPLSFLFLTIVFLLSSKMTFAASTCVLPGQPSTYNLDNVVNISTALNTVTYIPLGVVVIPRGTASCGNGDGEYLTVGLYDMWMKPLSLENASEIVDMDSYSKFDMTFVIAVNGHCTNSNYYTQLNTGDENLSNISLCLKITTGSNPPAGTHFQVSTPQAYIVVTNSPYGGMLPDSNHITGITEYGLNIITPYVCWNSGISDIDLGSNLSSDYLGKAGAIIGQKKTFNLLFSCNSYSGDEQDVDISLTTSSLHGTDIATTNPDIAVRVFDQNGNIITADGKKKSYRIDFSRTGQITNPIPLSFAPVAVTGNKPAAGPFQATVTMSVYYP